MAENIIDTHTAAQYQWGENCTSWLLVDTPGLSVKQECMPGGTKEQLHVHGLAQQFFFILSGTASFYVQNAKLSVQEQKGILILPGTEHYIANETNTPLSFLVISQPSTINDRKNLVP